MIFTIQWRNYRTKLCAIGTCICVCVIGTNNCICVWSMTILRFSTRFLSDLKKASGQVLHPTQKIRKDFWHSIISKNTSLILIIYIINFYVQKRISSSGAPGTPLKGVWPLNEQRPSTTIRYRFVFGTLEITNDLRQELLIQLSQFAWPVNFQENNY